VRKIGEDGWLVIEPPPGSFVWVEQSALRRQKGGTQVRIGVDDAVFRAGHPGARMLGIPQGTLARGTTVQLFDRPPLSVGQPAKSWARRRAPRGHEPVHPGRRSRVEERRKACRARTGDPRGVLCRAADALAHRRPSRPRSAGSSQPTAQSFADRSTSAAPANPAGLPGLAEARGGRRLHDRDPVPARPGCTHEAAAEAARAIEATLDASRERDRKLTLYLRRIAQAEDPQERPYDAMGMLQPSSRRVAGEKVFALIGAEGRAWLT